VTGKADTRDIVDTHTGAITVKDITVTTDIKIILTATANPGPDTGVLTTGINIVGTFTGITIPTIIEIIRRVIAFFSDFRYVDSTFRP
jgi:hypothetical protein